MYNLHLAVNYDAADWLLNYCQSCHLGELRTGNSFYLFFIFSEVGVRSSNLGLVLQDLKNARTIVQWVAWAEPDYDFGPVMDEWCNEVPKELNFNLEAGISPITSSNLEECIESCGSNIHIVSKYVVALVQLSLCKFTKSFLYSRYLPFSEHLDRSLLS